jgi:hypothetical protein
VGLAELGRRHHRRGAGAKIAKDRGIGGPLLSASSYFMKSPPQQYADHDAKQAVEAFIAARSAADPSLKSPPILELWLPFRGM